MNINKIRFWSKVAKSSRDACWDWTAGRFPYGYGAFAIGGTNKGSHIVAWSLANGRWPQPGHCVCHTCDRPSCCNPRHLFLGTPRDNWYDSVSKGRRAHVRLPPASEHPDKMPRGELHWAVKRYGVLNESLVRSIKEMFKDGRRQCEIMRALNLPRRAVQRVVSGRVWKHVK
jgi:hypothetical protein